MGTRAKLSTKALSLFLAVLMAAGVFSIALPGLAPVALAAADREVSALENALQAAVDGGYLGTANYAVNRTDNAVTVDDQTSNGYLYAVVRAVADLYAKIGAEEGSDHGKLVLSYIEGKLTLNTYQRQFISDILFAGLTPETEGDNFPYNYYKDTDDTVWYGLTSDVAALPETVTLTVTATRTAKAATLNDYSDVRDIPAEGVQTTYVFTVEAAKNTETEGVEDGYTKVWYANTSATAEGTNATAPADIAAIKAYVDYVNGETFKQPYENWVASNGSSLYQEDGSVLAMRESDFAAKRAAAAATDADLQRAYIDIDLMNGDYWTFAQASTVAAQALNKTPYADWIKGENIPASVEANSINKNDYDITDYARMEALVEQATAYLTILRGNTGNTPSAVETNLKENYGYDPEAYPAYIAEMKNNVELYKLSLVKDALDYVFANEGDAKYTFPADSIFNGGATQVTDTEPDPAKTYYKKVDYGNGNVSYEALDIAQVYPLSSLYVAKETAYERTADLAPNADTTYYTLDPVYTRVKDADLGNYTLTDLYIQVKDGEGHTYYEQNTSAAAQEGVKYYVRTEEYNAVDQSRFVLMSDLYEAVPGAYTAVGDTLDAPVPGVTYYKLDGENYVAVSSENILTLGDLYERTYSAVTYTEPVEGVVYYTQNTDGTYARADVSGGFAENTTYYIATNTFHMTADTAVKADKTYYIKSADGTEYYEISGGDVLDIHTLYTQEAASYVLTEDADIVAGKTYYVYNANSDTYAVKANPLVFLNTDLYEKLSFSGDAAYEQTTDATAVPNKTYYARIESYAEIDAQAYLDADAAHHLTDLFVAVKDEETGAITGYVACTDSAVAPDRVYYTRNARYAAVKGKDLVNLTDCYTVSGLTVYGVANRSYYSQAYAENGFESPMDYAALSADIAWFGPVISLLQSASTENLIKVFNRDKNATALDDTAKLYLGTGATVCQDIAGANDAQSAARGWVRDVYNDLQIEQEYRRATNTNPENIAEQGKIDNFLEHYRFFVDNMLLGSVSDYSTAALMGGLETAVTDENNVTTGTDTEFDEYGNLKAGSCLNDGFIATAVKELAALRSAYNALGDTTTESNNRYRDNADSFINLAEQYVYSLYSAVLTRTYNEYVQVETNWTNFNSANTNALKAQRYSLVTGSIAALDSDQKMGGLQNIARVYINSTNIYTSAVMSKISNGTSMKDEINRIHRNTYKVTGSGDNIKVDDPDKGWYATAKDRMLSLRWQDGTFGSSFYGINNSTKVINRVGTAADIARIAPDPTNGITGDVYTVDEDKMDTLIDHLDHFLSSADFATLIGADSSIGINSLGDYIEDVLSQNLFNGNMVNTIVALLYPMLQDLFDNKLTDLIANSSLGGGKVCQNASVAINTTNIYSGTVDIPVVGDLDIAVTNGVVDLFLNGESKNGITTQKFSSVFAGLGVHIWPSTFAAYLRNTSKVTNGAVKYASILTMLDYGASHGNTWAVLDKDGDGEIKKEDFDLWGVIWPFENGTTNISQGVYNWTSELGRVPTRYDIFIQVIGDVLGAAGEVLKTLFVNHNLNSDTLSNFVVADSHNVTVHLHKKILWTNYNRDISDIALSASGSGSVGIDGIAGYNTVWAPIFEALGMNSYSSTSDVSLSAPLSNSIGTSGNCTNAQLINALFMPLYALIKKLAGAPISTLTDILPNVAYNLVYDGITPLLKSLATKFHVHATLGNFDCDDAEFELFGLFDVNIAWIVNAFSGTITNAANNALSDLAFDLDVGSLFDINSVLPFDITNLNSIVGFILGQINNDIVNGLELPAINASKLAGLGTRNTMTTIRNNGNQYKASNHGVYNAETGKYDYQGHAYKIYANKANVLYSILKFVLTYATQDAEKLGGLLSALPYGLGGKLVQILKNGDPDQIIAGLTELFIPYEGSYKLKNYDWASAITTANPGNYKIPQAGFVYLRYANDWTREKAEYVYNNFDNVANSVMELLEVAGFSEYNGVSDWLLKTVNKMFTNKGIEGVLNLLLKLNAAFDGESKALPTLLEKTVNVGGETLKISDWMKRFGYLSAGNRVFDDSIVAHEGEGEEETTYTKKVIYLTKAGEYAIGELKCDASGNPVLTQKVEGNANSAVTEIEFVSSYALAPSTGAVEGSSNNFFGYDAVTTGTGDKATTTYTLLGAGQTPKGTRVGGLNWKQAEYRHVYTTVNGVRYDNYVKLASGDALRNADSFYGKKFVKNGSTKTGFNTVVAWDTSQSAELFTTLALEIMDQEYYDAHGTFLRWQITGTEDTEDFGILNGRSYYLADGELGTETDATNAGVSARAVFTGVFCELIKPVAPILNFLLCNRDLGFFKYGDTNTLTIKAYDTFNGALLPLLEALQVTDLMKSDQYAARFASDASGGFYYLTNKLFEALTNILTDDAPGTANARTALQKVVELLPHLFYFIQSNGLGTLLHNLLMPVWVLVDTIRPLASVDLDDLVHQALCSLLKLNYARGEHPYETSPVSDILVNIFQSAGTFSFQPYSVLQAKKDKNMVDAIYDLSLEDLGLEAIGTAVTLFTGMDIAPIRYAFEGMRYAYSYGGKTYGVKDLNSSQTKYYDIATYNNNNGSKVYKSKTLDYYGPDILTVTLSAVLDTLRYKDNAAALDEMIGLLADVRPGETLNTNVTAAGLLEALEKVFLDRADTDYDVPNWDYFLEGQKRVKISGNGNTIAWVNGDYEKLRQVIDFDAYHSINNLDAYRRPDNQALTDWTRDTAIATDQVLSNILDFITVSFLAKDTGAASFEEFVDDLLDKNVFNGELLRTISGFIAQLFNFLPLEVVKAVDKLLDTSIVSWAVPESGKSAFIVPVDVNGYPVSIESADIKSWVVNDENPYWRANRKDDGSIYAENDSMYWVGPDYVDSADAFLDVVAEMLMPAAKLISILFLKDSYKLFYTAGSELSIGTGYEYTSSYAADWGDDAIVLDGLNAYETVLVPLLEALGMRPGTELYPDTHPLLSAASFTETVNGVTTYKTEDFVNYLLKDVLKELINNIKANPVDYLLNILPGLVYFINAHGLTTAIRNLFKAVGDVVQMINNRLERSSRIDIGNLAGISLDNLTLEGVLGIVEKLTSGEDENGNFLAGLHVNASLLEYLKNLYVGDLYYFDSPAHGGTSFSMKYSTVEDRADMITILVALLLEIAEDKDDVGYANPYNNYETTPWNNPAVIDRLAGTDGMVEAIVKALTNPKSLDGYAQIDWFYFDKNFNLADPDYVVEYNEDTGLVTKVESEDHSQSLNLAGYAFQYLNYRTLWTYEKAASLTDPATLEGLIVEILNMINEDNQIERLSELEINGIPLGNATDLLTGDLLQKLMSLLSNALFGNNGLKINDDLTLTPDIIQLAGNLLGADLGEWNYQYQFYTAEHEAYKTAETETGTEGGLTYYMLPVIVPDYDSRGVQKKDADGNLLYTTKKDADDNEMLIKTFVVNGKTEFVTGLTKILNPAARLLGWLLFEDNYKFFVGNTYETADNYLIQLPGSNGYGMGLALLLEALGVKGLKNKSAYKTALGYDTAAFINDLANSLVNRVEEILNDPIAEVSALVSELIYFINAKGLQTVIQNLLAGPLALVNELTDLLGDVLGLDEDGLDVFGLVDGLVNKALAGALSDVAGRELTEEDIGFNFKNVNLDFVFTLLELISGLDLKGPAGNRLAYFRIGGLYHYISAGDVINAYKMQFTDSEDFADFVTILLSFVVDVITYEGNREAIADLIGRFLPDGENKEMILQIIEAALELITKGFSTEIRDINWFYFDPEYSIYDENGDRNAVEIDENTRFTLPARSINYLSYMSNWNEDLANYLNDGLEDGSLIEMLKDMISGVEIGSTTLYDLLKGSQDGHTPVKLEDFDFFGPGPLNSIAEALGQIKIPQAIGELLNIILDINLNGLGEANYFGSQEDFDKFAATLPEGETLAIETEAETGLQYAEIGKLIEKTEKVIDPETGNEVVQVVKDEDGKPVMVYETENDVVKTYKTYLIDDKDSFVAGLCKLLSPFNVVLDWLLFGENTELKYFDKIEYEIQNGELVYDDQGNPKVKEGSYRVLLSLKGANGYQYGLVPILEALGIDAPKHHGTETTTEMLPAVIDAAFDRVDDILAADSPIIELMGIIPNLLYFINANGLSASVHNLLAAPFALLDIINENLPEDSQIDIIELIQKLASNMNLNFTLDINHLELDAVIGILEGLLSKEDGPQFRVFKENGGFVEKAKIENFYLGKIEWFDSASGRPAFKMVYTEQENAIDMLTIVLNFAVELILHKDEENGVDNAAAIDALINSDKFSITDIVSIIQNLKDDAIPGEYHWNYFNEADDDAVVPRDLYGRTPLFIAPKTPFLNYLTYATDWTEELADGLYANLPAIIDAVIGMTAKEDTDPHTLGELVNSKLNIYTADTLNKITGAVQGLLTDDTGENGTTIALILDILGLVLGTDLTVWKDLHFEESQITDRDTFLAGLNEFLRPVYPILDWLLFAGNLGFFVKAEDGNVIIVNGKKVRGDGELIAVRGAEGYAYGLVPLLETLGVTLPAYTVGDPEFDINDFFPQVLNAVFTRVDAILADPVTEALDLLPQLLYFINANGLATMVQNLLGGVVNAAEKVFESGMLDSLIGDALGGQTDVFDIIENLLQEKAGLSLNLNNLDLEGIFHLLETLEVNDELLLKGLKLNDVFTRKFATTATQVNNNEAYPEADDGVLSNILEKFYIGTGARRVESSVKGYDIILVDGEEQIKRDDEGRPITKDYYIYKMDEAGSGDVFTLLLSIVLEVALWEDNEQPIADLLAGVLTDKTAEERLEIVRSLKAILAGNIGVGRGGQFNWDYFVEGPGYADWTLEDMTTIDGLKAFTDSLLPQRTQNYLVYKNNWNEPLAEELFENIDSIANQIIALIPSIEAEGIADLIQNSIDLFTQENAEKVRDLIADLLGNIDAQLLETAGALIGAQGISQIGSTDMSYVADASTFAQAMTEMIRPINKILSWLLFGGEYKFFTYLKDGETAMITLKGGEGYNTGLAPILYMLGVDTDLSGAETNEDKIAMVIRNVCLRIDELLYGNAPVDAVLQLLPRLIYFINANGISASVLNLVAPINNLLDAVNEIHIIDQDISLSGILNSALANIEALEDKDITIDVNKIDFTTIFDLVQAFTGIVLSDPENGNAPIGDYLPYFYFGQIKHEKINDFDEFTMVYSETEEKHDMFTILVSVLLDVLSYEGNKDFIIDLLKNVSEENAEQIYYIVMDYLLGDDTYVKKYNMRDYAWAWLEFADTGTILSPLAVNGGSALLDGPMYGPLYTPEMGQYMTKYLTLLIDTYITLLGIENKTGGTYRSIDELLDELIGSNIFTKSLLTTITDAIKNAIEGLKETVGEELFNQIVSILEKVLDVDLDVLLDYRVPANFPEGNQQAFVAEICKMLSPAAPLLRFLLTGQNIAVFSKGTDGSDYVKLRGAKGYEYAIVPIIEALYGGDPEPAVIMTQAEYEARTNRPENATQAQKQAADAAMLELILNPILDRLNQILEDPLTEIFEELPAVIYFIQSKGLDTAFKNLLNPVFELLTVIAPVLADVEISGKKLYKTDTNGNVIYDAQGKAEPDLYGLIGINLEEMDMAAIVDMLIGLIPSDASVGELSLSSVVRNALGDLVLGKVVHFTSHRQVPETSANARPGATGTDFAYDCTMVYGTTDNSTGTGSKVDLVTIILKILLSFISQPDNVKVVERLLKDKLNENGYKFLCSLLENFSQFASTRGGQDKIMYTLYYIFYSALTAGVATNNGLANFNYNYSFMNQLFATSDLALFKQMEASFGDLLDKWTGDVVDRDEVVPNGFIKFFQSIIDFFKRIGNFFKRLFGG